MKNEKINLLTVGSDAEMFLQDTDTGEIISAEGYIKGSKDEPFYFDESDPYASTQLDNVLAEVTIKPATKMEEFADGLLKSIDFVRSILPKNIIPVALPAANLDDRFLQTEQACIFGCQPDFNAYDMYMNHKPFCEDYTLRSSGGHLHLGYDNLEVPFNDDELFNYEPDPQRSRIVKVLDLFISVPLVLIEPDNKRKELYGKAGAFRPKPYGLEYRTPSNYFLNSRELMNWVYSNTHKAINFLNEIGELPIELGNQIRSVIDNNNKEEAKALIADFNIEVV